MPVEIMKAKKKFTKEFELYACKRASKLDAFFRKIARPSDTVAVHDFRKATRRLQDVVAACGADHAGRKVKRPREGCANSATR
jgi:hypothetical protein